MKGKTEGEMVKEERYDERFDFPQSWLEPEVQELGNEVFEAEEEPERFESEEVEE